MSKIILVWGILLAVAFAHAQDSWHDDEDWYEGSVDDVDSFMSGTGTISGMEETLGGGNVDEYGEDEIGIEDHDLDNDYDDHDYDYDDEDDFDDFDDDYSDDDDAGFESKTRRRSRRSAKPCKTGCKVCAPLKLNCRVCKKGYKQRGAGCIKITPKPLPPTPASPKNVQHCTAVPNCLDCPGTAMPWFRSCKKCAKGWMLHQETFRTVCTKKCPQGYQATNDNNGFLQCSAMRLKCPKMPGCEQCPTDRLCTKCAGKLILYDDVLSSKCVKKCPFSYNETVNKNGIRVCKQQDGCRDRLCSSCKSGLFRADYKGKVCHKQCPPGYRIFWSHFCKKCPTGCKTCNSAGCQVCNNGLSWHAKTTFLGLSLDRPSCVKNCPNGFRRVFVQGKGFECHKVPKTTKPGDLP